MERFLLFAQFGQVQLIVVPVKVPKIINDLAKCLIYFYRATWPRHGQLEASRCWILRIAQVATGIVGPIVLWQVNIRLVLIYVVGHTQSEVGRIKKQDRLVVRLADVLIAMISGIFVILDGYPERSAIGLPASRPRIWAVVAGRRST